MMVSVFRSLLAEQAATLWGFSAERRRLKATRRATTEPGERWFSQGSAKPPRGGRFSSSWTPPSPSSTRSALGPEGGFQERVCESYYAFRQRMTRVMEALGKAALFLDPGWTKKLWCAPKA